MKNNYYTQIDHSTYGGEITAWSFDGHTTLTDIAENIAQDLRFDNQCRRNTELKERGKK